MDKKSSPLILRKVESKNPSCRNVEAIDLHGSSDTPPYEDSPEGDGKGNVRLSKPEPKRSLFRKNHGSRVAPCPKDGSEGDVAVSNGSFDCCSHHKNCEDLSLIFKQLVQIENQQSGLMDLLQKFIGSSQDGMRSLETRVHGLAMALDDISYDMAVSTARMSNVEPARTSYWLLPRSDFLSSKFWRKVEGCSKNTTAVSAMNNISYKSPAGYTYKLKKRVHLQGEGGVIVNPLAEIHGNSGGISEASSSGVLKNAHNVA